MIDIKPEISVIVPIFNSENFMDKCVESLVNQTYPNIEILLIDDGSTDNSYEKCKKWAMKDNRIKIFHESNKGVSSARNLGIQKSVGNRIVFVDSDDWLDINTFKFIMDNYEEYDLVIWNYADCDNGKMTMSHFTYDVYIADSPELLNELKKNGFAGEDENGISFDLGLKNIWNRSVKRSILIDNNLYFDAKLKNHEDFLFAFLTYEYVKNIVTVDKPFYFRLIRNESVSRSFNPLIYENNKYAYEKMEKFIENNHPNDIWYLNSVKQYYTGWFIQILLKYYFHKESEMSFIEAYNKTKILINEKPYDISFDYKLNHTSMKKKIFCFLAENKMIFIISFICKFI